MTTFACMGLTHGDCLNIKMSSYQYRDPHLIFNMGITIPGKDALKSSQLWQQFILHSVLLCFGGGPFCPYPSGSFHSLEQSNNCPSDTWWRHQKETFSALLAISVGNSVVTSEFQWHKTLMFPFICTWINDWVNNGEAGDLRSHCAHYIITVMSEAILKNVSEWPHESTIYGWY